MTDQRTKPKQGRKQPTPKPADTEDVMYQQDNEGVWQPVPRHPKHMKRGIIPAAKGAIKRLFRQHRLTRNKERVVLVTMELSSGDEWTAWIIEENCGFLYRGKWYHFDGAMKIYNQTNRHYHFYFHEDFALPVRHRVDITDLKEVVNSTGGRDITIATNPSVLRTVLQSDIAMKIVKGQEMDNMMRQIIRILIIVGAVVVIHLFVYLQQSGILSGIL